VVGLDVVQGFDIPGRGQFERTVDLIETGNQIVIQRPCAASHQGIGDVAQVVANVAGALGLAARIGGIIGALKLGGVGIFGVYGLGGTVDQFIGLGGKSLGGSQGVGRTLKAPEGSVELGVAEVAALGVSSGDSFGEWSLGHGSEALGENGIRGKVEAQLTAAAARSK